MLLSFKSKLKFTLEDLAGQWPQMPKNENQTKLRRSSTNCSTALGGGWRRKDRRLQICYACSTTTPLTGFHSNVGPNGAWTLPLEQKISVQHPYDDEAWSKWGGVDGATLRRWWQQSARRPGERVVARREEKEGSANFLYIYKPNSTFFLLTLKVSYIALNFQITPKLHQLPNNFQTYQNYQLQR